MDYTKLPRHLVYLDRKDIDDFPVYSRFDYTTMEESFLDALERQPFIKESYDAPEMILKIFNNARYITTLICMESHPNHYLRKYLEKAGSNDRRTTIANHAMPATMALVKNYLCHYMPSQYADSKIVEDITNNFDTKAWKEYSIGGQDDFYKLVIDYDYTVEHHPGWLCDPQFKPRDVREFVTDPLVTARDISENIDYILESLEKNVAIFDEEIAPLNAMYKKVEAWFPSGIDDNLHKELALSEIDTRLKKLDPNDAYGFFNIMNEIEKNLYTKSPISSKTKEEINKYMKKTLGVDMNEIASAASPCDQTDAEKEEVKACALESKTEKADEKINMEWNGDDEENEECEDDDEGKGTLGVPVYDTTYDYIFDQRVKPQALFNAMKGIKYSNKITDRRFYYVAYRVFDAINYFSKGTSEHQYLQWVNLHFNDSENRWIDDHDHIYLFRFKLDGTAKKLKVHPSKWNAIKMYSDLATIHYELAQDLKNTFTFVIDDNGAELKDSKSYEHLKDYPQYLSGARWIVDRYLVPEDAYINKG